MSDFVDRQRLPCFVGEAGEAGTIRRSAGDAFNPRPAIAAADNYGVPAAGSA